MFIHTKELTKALTEAPPVTPAQANTEAITKAFTQAPTVTPAEANTEAITKDPTKATTPDKTEASNQAHTSDNTKTKTEASIVDKTEVSTEAHTLAHIETQIEDDTKAFSKECTAAHGFPVDIAENFWKSACVEISCTNEGNCIVSELVTEPSIKLSLESLGHTITVPSNGITIKLIALDDRVKSMQVYWYKDGRICHVQPRLKSDTIIHVDEKVMAEWGSSFKVEFRFDTPPGSGVEVLNTVESISWLWPFTLMTGNEFSIVAKKEEIVPLRKRAAEGSPTPGKDARRVKHNKK